MTGPEFRPTPARLELVAAVYAGQVFWYRGDLTRWELPTDHPSPRTRVVTRRATQLEQAGWIHLGNKKLRRQGMLAYRFDLTAAGRAVHTAAVAAAAAVA